MHTDYVDWTYKAHTLCDDKIVIETRLDANNDFGHTYLKRLQCHISNDIYYIILLYRYILLI